MDSSHLTCPIQGLDLLDLAVLATDYRLPTAAQPHALRGELIFLLGMPDALLYAVRGPADAWRVITKASARRAGRAGRQVVFWPVFSSAN